MESESKLLKNHLNEWIQKNEKFVIELKEARNNPKGFTFEPYLKNKEYLEIGRWFQDVIIDLQISDDTKIELLAFSEENDHLFHNAAVLWLESQQPSQIMNINSVATQSLDPQASQTFNTLSQQKKLDYEERLKWHWIIFVLGKDNTPKSRKEALIIYLWDHTTLGKVILRRKTQFHENESIKTHPAYWGLFMFSPRYRDDIGIYTATGDDLQYFNEISLKVTQNEEVFRSKFQKLLQNNELNKPQIEQLKQARAYEFFPRRFADQATLPGVYLHRSFAHGRDDFLVLKNDGNSCMVCCTKGVGANGDLILKSTAGQHHPDFFSNWDKKTDKLPFSFIDNPKAGSWAPMGFCLINGDLGSADETEIASIDFHNFGNMYDQVCNLNNTNKNNTFQFLTKSFVEPFICIQLTSLKKSFLLPAMLEGIGKGKISFPVQVITCAPQETSLRLDKQGLGQDYDYGYLELETAEWKRCLNGIVLDEQMNLWMTADANRNYADDWAERVENAYKHIIALFGSYVAFVSYGWATDRWTGSLSGRNFNGGPRDAHMWGSMARGREDSTGESKPGYTAHVDIDDVTQTITTLLVKLHFTIDEMQWLVEDGGQFIKVQNALLNFAGEVGKILNELQLDEERTGKSVKFVQKALRHLAATFAETFNKPFFPIQVKELFISGLPDSETNK